MMIRSAEFIKSATKLSQAPDLSLPEVAFIGRSNVGKSSVINMLTNRNGLAKSSVKPGKTQLVNYFLVNEKWYLVDLPGYGYAKINLNARRQWMDMIQEYMLKSDQLRVVFVLVDASISPQQIDVDFVEVLAQEELPFVILFNKVDKASQKDVAKNIKNFGQKLSELGISGFQSFQASAIKKRGTKQILEFLDSVIF